MEVKMTITTISSEKDKEKQLKIVIRKYQKLIGCATFVQSRKLFILDSSRGYNVFDFGKD